MKKLKYLFVGIMFLIISTTTVKADRGLYLTSELPNANVNINEEFTYKVKLDYGVQMYNEAKFIVTFDGSSIEFIECKEVSQTNSKIANNLSDLNTLNINVDRNNANIIELEIKFKAKKEADSSAIKLQAVKNCSDDIDCGIGIVEDNSIIRNITVNSNEPANNENETTDVNDDITIVDVDQNQNSFNDDLVYILVIVDIILLVTVVVLAINRKKNKK